MSFEVILLPELLEDLQDAYFWYEEQRIGLGDDLEQEFYDLIATTRSNPLLLQIRYSQIRIAWLNRFPYGIHFYVSDKCIFVSAFIHTSRNPKVWLERLNP